MDKQEYLDLILKLIKEEEDAGKLPDYPELNIEPIKIDLTNADLETIKQALIIHNNITIDSFFINCRISKHLSGNSIKEFTFCLYEANGKLLNKINLASDKRFVKFSKFTQSTWFSQWQGMNLDEAAEIIVWLQKVNKLRGFI